MNLNNSMLGVLKDFESTVVDYWREHPDLSDHAVKRVYEEALVECDAARRGRRPRPHTLAGTDLELFHQVKAVADYRLGQGPKPPSAAADVEPQPLELVTKALRELVRSVAARNLQGGRQGYLEYIQQFLPKRGA